MNTNKYVFIGDSLTFGYGINKNDNWVTKIKNILGCNVINKGINGNTTTDMLNRFSQDVIDNNPCLVFIMGGTNDLLSKRNITSIIKNIELMIKDCISINSKVIIGIPPTIISKDANKLFSPSPNYDYCESQLPILRNELIKLCCNYDIDYIDLYSLTEKNLSKDIFNDGIHLNILGQELICKEALKKLQSIKW